MAIVVQVQNVNAAAGFNVSSLTDQLGVSSGVSSFVEDQIAGQLRTQLAANGVQANVYLSDVAPVATPGAGVGIDPVILLAGGGLLLLLLLK